jgi:hypothetical protein
MMIGLLDRHLLHDRRRGGWAHGIDFGLPVIV